MMTTMSDDAILYPDVLGLITQQRFNLGALQYTVGLSKQTAKVHEPMEIIVVMQSMVASNMRVAIGVHPLHDAPVEIDKQMIQLGLRMGEVGVLRVPITIRKGDVPLSDMVQLGISVRYRTSPQLRRLLRLPNSGLRPQNLETISPYRVSQLQDFHYGAERWHKTSETVLIHIQTQDRELPYLGQPARFSYETLWSDQEFLQKTFTETDCQQAVHLLDDLNNMTHYQQFWDLIEALFIGGGLMLYPGELKAATTLVYGRLLLDIRHQNLDQLLQRHWFQMLLQQIKEDMSMTQMPSHIIAFTIFEALLYDALLWGCQMLKGYCTDLPDHIEATCGYGLMFQVGRDTRFDLQSAYYPLVLGGVMALATSELRNEFLADSKELLLFAYQRRQQEMNPSNEMWLGVLRQLLG